MGRTRVGADGKRRCQWCGVTPRMVEYHDSEWGFPCRDEFLLFEKLCLEGFQSGLSWRTILDKRDNFRAAFLGFDYRKIAAFGPRDVTRLMKDAGIVRHRGKIEAVINNAQRALELITTEGSLVAYFWSFRPADPPVARPQTQSVSPVSRAMSKDLKRRGWRFVGPTTTYAFMQAMGQMNDHLEQCHVRALAEKARSEFKRPKR